MYLVTKPCIWAKWTRLIRHFKVVRLLVINIVKNIDIRCANKKNKATETQRPQRKIMIKNYKEKEATRRSMERGKA